MKIYAISDLHLSNSCDKPMDVFGGNWENYTQKISDNWKKKVTDEDLVLIAGDISWAMKLDEAKADLEWIENLPGKKIIIKGNHEYWWKSISSVREILPPSIMAIQNDSIKFENVVVCGTRGWTVPEPDKELEADDLKIYKRELERLKLTLMSANVQRQNNETLIVMIHYPPFNMEKQNNEMLELFKQYKVDIVVFGHLHGYTKCDRICEINGVKYYFTSCDHINNDPVEIEINK